MSLFAVLKRRNVLRVAGLYLIAAWLIVQVAETVLPTFDVPAWVLRATIVLLAIGFIPALTFSWVFEFTPPRLKRDEKVDPAHSVVPRTARRMDRMLVAVSALAIAYFAFDKFVLAPQRDVALVTQTAEQVNAEANADKSKVNPHAIAVLPFVNMFGDVHTLVWFEQHETTESASSREKALKAWNRDWTLNLDGTMNPEWRDRYPEIIGNGKRKNWTQPAPG